MREEDLGCDLEEGVGMQKGTATNEGAVCLQDFLATGAAGEEGGVCGNTGAEEALRGAQKGNSRASCWGVVVREW